MSLIRIFEVFSFTTFPAQTWPFVIFTQLIGGIGRYTISVEIVDLKDYTLVASGEGSIEFPDRVRAVKMMLPVPPLVLLHSGAYDVVLLADGCEIDRQQFNASLREDQPGDSQDNQDDEEDEEDEEGDEDAGEGP